MKKQTLLRDAKTIIKAVGSLSITSPKNIKTLLLLISLFATPLLLTACDQPSLPEPASKGARLYVEKCILCHPVKHPKILNYKLWVRRVKLMEKKVKKSGIREPLSEEDRDIILAYLKKHARNSSY